jgi:hypothetical protein
MKRQTTKREVSAEKIQFKYPRQSCGYCENLIFNWCVIFDDAVPKSFLTTKNECEHFCEALAP